jgi:hypothetical protein
MRSSAECSAGWFAEVGASNTLPVLQANSQSEDAPRADFPVAALATFLRCALCHAAVQQRKCRSENSDRKIELFKFVSLSEGEIEEEIVWLHYLFPVLLGEALTRIEKKRLTAPLRSVRPQFPPFVAM